MAEAIEPAPEVNQNEIHINVIDSHHQVLNNQESNNLQDVLIAAIDARLAISNTGDWLNNSHKQSTESIISDLQTNRVNGLSIEEAARRLLIYGKNTIPFKTPFKKRILRSIQREDVYLWLLVILSIVAACINLSQTQNIIFAVLLFLFAIHQSIRSYYYSQYQVKFPFTPKAAVIRNKEKMFISVEDLVRGDVILLCEGNKVPADIRIIDTYNLQVDNSSLTGEGYPVLLNDQVSTENNILESKNMAFESVACIEGHATGIVVATGKRTIVGRIFEFLDEYNESKFFFNTPYQRPKGKVVFIIFALLIIGGILLIILADRTFEDVAIQISFIAITILHPGVIEGNRIAVLKSLNNLSTKHKIHSKSANSFELLEEAKVIFCAGIRSTLAEEFNIIKNLWLGGNCYSEQSEIPRDRADVLLLEKAVFLCQSNEDSTTKQFLKQKKYITNKTQNKNEYSYEPEAFMNNKTNIRFACQPDGKKCYKPFTGQQKFVSVIVEEPRRRRRSNDINGGYCESEPQSQYVLYIKGSFDYIFSHSSSYISAQNGSAKPITAGFKQNLERYVNRFHENAERIFAFARVPLRADRYPLGFKFTSHNNGFGVSPEDFFNFELIGLITIGNVPKPLVRESILELKAAVDVQVVLMTSSNHQQAVSIARQAGIISQEAKTNFQLQQSHPELSEYNSMLQADVAVINCSQFEHQNHNEINEAIPIWIKNKKPVIFARASKTYISEIISKYQRCSELSSVLFKGTEYSEPSYSLRASIKITSLANKIDDKTINSAGIDSSDIIFQNSGIESFLPLIQASKQIRKVTALAWKCSIISLISQFELVFISDIMGFVLSAKILLFALFFFWSYLFPITICQESLSLQQSPARLNYPSSQYEMLNQSQIDPHQQQLPNQNISKRNAKEKRKRLIKQCCINISIFGYFLKFWIVILLSSIVTLLSFGFKSPYILKQGFLEVEVGSDCEQSQIDLNYAQSIQLNFESVQQENLRKLDLRNVLVYCDLESMKWKENYSWGECNLHMSEEKQSMCYTLEGLLYAQSMCIFINMAFYVIYMLSWKTKQYIWKSRPSLKFICIYLSGIAFMLVCVYIPFMQDFLDTRGPFVDTGTYLNWIPLLLVIPYNEALKFLIKNTSFKLKWLLSLSQYK